MNHKDVNLEEKDILKLFNGIKLEESEFGALDEGISRIQKERIKKNLIKKIKIKRNWKIRRYSCTAAAIGLACLIGIGTVSPALAKNIPVLNSIIQILNDRMGSHGDYAEYSQMVNKTATDNGISITINEVLADDSKLVISYTVKSDKKIKDLSGFWSGDFKINGEIFWGQGAGMGEYIDDYTFVGSREIDVIWKEIPERFNVDLKITEIMDVKGKWEFVFSASKDEISKKSTLFKPDKLIDFPDSAVTVEKVVFSPIGTYIVLSGNYKEKDREATPMGLFSYDYWIAYDDKGVELIPKGAGISGDGKKFYGEMSYARVKDIPKYVTILPCRIIPSGGGGINLDDGTPIDMETKEMKEISKVIDGEYPIELSQGEIGKLIIKEIKTENGRTTVRFTAEGIAPYFQGTHLYIKDDDGEWLEVKNHDIRKDDQKPNEFTMEFEALDPSRTYRIGTTSFENIELREDLKFKIELNQ